MTITRSITITITISLINNIYY